MPARLDAVPPVSRTWMASSIVILTFISTSLYGMSMPVGTSCQRPTGESKGWVCTEPNGSVWACDDGKQNCKRIAKQTPGMVATQLPIKQTGQPGQGANEQVRAAPSATTRRPSANDPGPLDNLDPSLQEIVILCATAPQSRKLKKKWSDYLEANYKPGMDIDALIDDLVRRSVAYRASQANNPNLPAPVSQGQAASVTKVLTDVGDAMRAKTP